MSVNTTNFNLRKDGRNDYYNIDVVNENLDKIDSALKNIQNEALNKNGGNADTVDNKHASDFYPITGGVLDGKLQINKYGDGDETDRTTITENGIDCYSCSEYANEDPAYQSNITSYSITINKDDSETGENGTLKIDSSSIKASGSYNKTISGFDSVTAGSFIGNGSGLTNVNADTVDNKHATDFLNKYTINTAVDWNTITDTGVYHVITTEGTNRPDPNHGTLFVDSDIGTPYQIYIPDQPYNIYKRTIGGEWKKLNDGGNAATLGGKDLSYFQPHLNTTPRYEGDILNINDVGVYACNSIVCENLPEKIEGHWWYVWSIRFDDSGYNLYYATRLNFRDSDNSIYCASQNVSPGGTLKWERLNDSNSKSVSKFNVSLGSWYRLATNNKDSCGGVFVLTVGAGSSSSTTVFSATRQYSISTAADSEVKILSHSGFNTCVSKIRMATKSGGSYEQYIDFYVDGGTNGHMGDVEVRFFGKGWKIYDNVVSANIASGYATKEFNVTE